MCKANRSGRAILLLAVVPLFWNCEYFNRPLEPFIEKHTAEVSVESVEFLSASGAGTLLWNGTYMADPGPAPTVMRAVINLDNPANLALDFSLSWKTDDSLTASLGRTDNRSAEVRIEGARRGSQIELRLNVKAETSRTFRLSVPAAFNSELTVTLPSSPVTDEGGYVQRAHWIMQTPSQHPGIDKVVITYRYRNTDPEFFTETYGWDESLNSGSGGLTNAYGFPPWVFTNNAGNCGLNFPASFTLTPVEDYCFFSVEVHDKFGLSASAATPGFRDAAKVGGVYYLTLNDAINAVPPGGSASSPTVVALLANVDFPEPGFGTYTINNKHIKLTVPPDETYAVKRTAANSGAFFSVDANSSLTLAGNGTGQLILDGGGARAQTTVNWERPVVTVAGGELRMEAGTVIKDNWADMPAVYVTGGNFIMNGGEISGNKKASQVNWRGGAVIVTGSGASFTMNNGEIKNNTAYQGGGVQVGSGASFTMNGGEIKNNTATVGGNGWKGQGGGVFISGTGSTFTMTGGEISGNGVDGNGSGMNTERRGGGGVFVMGGGTFTMSGGSIQGNTIPANSDYNGKGVLIADGTFNMEGSAAINANNDVYLNTMPTPPTVMTIALTGSLAGSGTVATITPDTYATGRQILSGAFVAGSHGSFAVTPQGGTNWTINSAGQLAP
jgi:hypothetical protein